MSNSSVSILTPTVASATPSESEVPTTAPEQTSSGHGAFVPLLLCALTLLGWFAFQAFVLVGDHNVLQATHQAQQQTVDNAAKLRTSLNALASDTQRLADAGNPSAALLVAELRKRGITINVSAPNAAAEGTASASKP